MQITQALLVGNSRVQRSALSSVLEVIRELEIVYSVRSNERAITRLSTGDIDAVFLLLSDEDSPETSFLSELSMYVNSELPVIPVITGSKTSVMQQLRSVGIRTPHYFSMPRNPSDNKAFVRDIERVLSVKTNVLGMERSVGTPSNRPEMVCIVSSTGGPEALCQLLSKLDASFDLPILITQHMPENFIDKMCENLGRYAHLPVQRATDGAPILGGNIYVAPGDAHLGVRKKHGKYLCALNYGPPSAGCKPAGNIMLESAAKVTYGKLLAICLTGMGSDGTLGMHCVKEAGGVVIVQDEASSVVWGMPGSIVERGYHNHVLPLRDIATKIVQLSGSEGDSDVSCAS